MSEEILILTDEALMPQNDQHCFYAFLHLLLLQLAKENGLKLIFLTPKKALEMDSLPSVILDRTLRYDADIIALHQQILATDEAAYLNHPKIMTYFASKWQTYQLLEEQGILQAETQLLTQLSDLEAFLRKYLQAVVKPEWGGMGDRVYFLEVKNADRIEVSWVEGHGAQSIEKSECMSLTTFYKMICSPVTNVAKDGVRANVSSEGWIIQKFLDLSAGRRQAMDIRVIEQRDGDGNLVPTFCHGRISNHHNIPLTNLSKGGCYVPIGQVLDGTSVKAKDIMQVCKGVDAAIEGVTGHQIGEVGHDLAVALIDDGWKIFYIEGNTMPGYVLKAWSELCSHGPITALLSLRDRRLLQNPLLYMQYLIELKENA